MVQVASTSYATRFTFSGQLGGMTKRDGLAPPDLTKRDGLAPPDLVFYSLVSTDVPRTYLPHDQVYQSLPCNFDTLEAGKTYSTSVYLDLEDTALQGCAAKKDPNRSMCQRKMA
jgi:hypothetical protein